MDKVVFFDIDGTLVNTAHFSKVARMEAMTIMVENGLPMKVNEAYDMLMEIIKEKGPNYDKHFNILTKRVCGKENPMLVALGMITYHNVKYATIRPFPKTIQVLIYLRNRGYRLGVISNGRTRKQWEKLVRLDIHYFFEEVITSEDIGFEKPNKEIFEEALKRMNCEAKDSIMIGDKFNSDIVGAITTKFEPILVNSGLDKESKKELLENFDFTIIDDIGELLNIL